MTSPTGTAKTNEPDEKKGDRTHWSLVGHQFLCSVGIQVRHEKMLFRYPGHGGRKMKPQKKQIKQGWFDA